MHVQPKFHRDYLYLHKLSKNESFINFYDLLIELQLVENFQKISQGIFEGFSTKFKTSKTQFKSRIMDFVKNNHHKCS